MIKKDINIKVANEKKQTLHPLVSFTLSVSKNWKFHLNWISIIIVALLLLEYNFYEIDPQCYPPKTFKNAVHHMSTGLAISTTVIVLLFSIRGLCYTICSFHAGKFASKYAISLAIIAFANLVLMTIDFCSRSCLELNLIDIKEYREMSKFRRVFIKYDTKFAGLYHLFITILSISACSYVAKIRSDLKLAFLEKKGLIREYLLEMTE